MKRKSTQAQPCPCGGGAYATCCEPLHRGAAAGDAAKLMRSRYSAYVLGLADYLQATWHASTRPAELTLQDDEARWIGLDLRRHEVLSAQEAQVEFIARYRVGGRAHRLHELSRFVLEDGRWYYVDGDIREN